MDIVTRFEDDIVDEVRIPTDLEVPVPVARELLEMLNAVDVHQERTPPVEFESLYARKLAHSRSARAFRRLFTSNSLPRRNWHKAHTMFSDSFQSPGRLSCTFDGCPLLHLSDLWSFFFDRAHFKLVRSTFVEENLNTCQTPEVWNVF